MNEVVERLNLFIANAYNLEDHNGYAVWLRQIIPFMKVAVGAQAADDLAKLGGDNPINFWSEYRDRQIGHLEGLVLTLNRSISDSSTILNEKPTLPHDRAANVKKVFLVHGHDVSARESVARFIEKLQLTTVILHEQTNEGRTIIEKFEVHADVGYAVVLLTPDDVGASASSPDKLLGRARQNVILELGYFTGKLGRRRVCGLFKPGVEVPSDFHGVLFIELDNQGGWRTKLAQELVSAGMKIDLQGLLQT